MLPSSAAPVAIFFPRSCHWALLYGRLTSQLPGGSTYDVRDPITLMLSIGPNCTRMGIIWCPVRWLLGPGTERIQLKRQVLSLPNRSTHLKPRIADFLSAFRIPRPCLNVGEFFRVLAVVGKVSHDGCGFGAPMPLAASDAAEVSAPEYGLPDFPILAPIALLSMQFALKCMLVVHQFPARSRPTRFSMSCCSALWDSCLARDACRRDNRLPFFALLLACGITVALGSD